MVPTEDVHTKNLDTTEPQTNGRPTRQWRNLVAFWFLGLCNNYGYVVMLSAAHDILKEEEAEASADGRGGEASGNLTTTTLPPLLLYANNSSSTHRVCNLLSTGAILLADVIPSLCIKFTAPFLPFYVHIRLLLCILLAAGGFLTVALSSSQAVSILGVVFTSLSSGLGEVTILQYSSFYDKNVVSTWSSGTGGAGIFGALSYALLNTLGPRNALLIMLIVPVIMAVTFWLLLMKPSGEMMAERIQRCVEQQEAANFSVALRRKVRKVPALIKYMLPLGLVYLFEYFINQGMFELIQYDDFFLSYADQYVWLQVDYQIGVFLSRSSVNILHIRRIWLMAVLQLVNVFVFSADAIFYVFPSYYVILALTLWEGLLGGAAYVNTFYRISSEVPEEDKQFSMGVTSFADTIGITLAGIFAMSAHNAVCKLPKPKRLL